MLIILHNQARTTPKIRAKIQARAELARQVAERFGFSEQTVWKRCKRDSVYDRSEIAHGLQTTLTPAQEAVVYVEHDPDAAWRRPVCGGARVTEAESASRRA